jgi:threonine/homoserine/homoserine lactone efflux protein
MTDFYPSTLILSILSFAIATAFTPGPNNLMLLSSGLTFGYKRTLSLIAGIMVGFPLMVVTVGLGIGELFQIFPMLYDILKVVGISYLLWMAWQISQAKGSLHTKETSKPFTFIQAGLFQWVNPKAWIMAITSTTSFISNEGSIQVQVLFIAFVYLVVGFFSTHSWVLGGVLLQKFIQKEKSLRIFNISMALLMVLSVLPFMFE